MFRASGDPGAADASDIACALDALSCVESGDESVLDIITRAAFPLDENDSMSSVSSSNSSLSSYDDADCEIAAKKARLSDDENDISEDYPVDPLKVAALSSAFSSHHVPTRKSKMYGDFINLNDTLESQQRGQFLLPLITSQSEEASGELKFNIKHEGILKALAESSKDFLKLESELPLSDDISDCKLKSLLLNSSLFKDLEPSPSSGFDSLGFGKMIASTLGHFYEEVDANFSRCTEAEFKSFAKLCDKPLEAKDYHAGEPANINIGIDEVFHQYLIRNCCDDAFLAEGGICAKRSCDRLWNFIKYRIEKYTQSLSDFEIVPSLVDMDECDSAAESLDRTSSFNYRKFFDPTVPQVIFDCDSINTRKRFIYDNRSEGTCPGGCGNTRVCSKFATGHSAQAEGLSSECDDKTKCIERDIKFVDMQAAWYELKTLLLWFYWALEKRLGDLSQLAIGFQVPCNCCYCSHVNVLSRLERLKKFNDRNDDSNATNPKCTCRKKKTTSVKVCVRTKLNTETNFVLKDAAKCSYCLNVEKRDKNSLADSIQARLQRYHKFLGMNETQRCCCTKMKPVEPSEDELSPVWVCSKNSDIPPFYVDLLTGFELSNVDAALKLGGNTVDSYYSQCRNHWIERDISNTEDCKESLYDSTEYTKTVTLCERCRCSCTHPKFYNFFQVISKMAVIIDNFTRISMTFLVYRMDDLFTALCARYSARLLIFLHYHCEYSFLLELARTVHIFKDAYIWLKSMLGPARSRVVFSLFNVIPAQQFLHMIYKRAASPALDIFLKLCVMLTHNVLPQEWKSAMLYYIDILPFIYDAEILTSIDDNLAYPRSGLDNDEDFVKILYRFYSINKKFLTREKVGYHNFNICSQEFKENVLPNMESEETKKFYEEVIKEVESKKAEIDLMSKIPFNGWRNFEKLAVYAMIKAYATDDHIYDSFVNYLIEKAFERCNAVSYSFKNDLNADSGPKTPLQLLVEATDNFKLSRSEKQLHKDYIANGLKKLDFKFIARIIYFKLSKRCRNEWLKCTSIGYHEFVKKNRVDNPLASNDKTVNCNKTVLLNKKAIDPFLYVFYSVLENCCPENSSSDSVPDIVKSSYDDIWTNFNSVLLEIDSESSDQGQPYLYPDIDIFTYNNIIKNFKLKKKFIENLTKPRAIIYDNNFDNLRKNNYDVLRDKYIKNQDNEKTIMLTKSSNKLKIGNLILDKQKWILLTVRTLSAIDMIKNKIIREQFEDLLNYNIEVEINARQLCDKPILVGKCDNNTSGVDGNVDQTTEQSKCTGAKKSAFKEDGAGKKKKSLPAVNCEEILNIYKNGKNVLDIPYIFESMLVFDHLTKLDKKGKLDKYTAKDLEAYLTSDRHLYNPVIEEVEEELSKTKVLNTRSKEEFERDLQTICFKMVARHMVEELIPFNENLENLEKRRKKRKLRRTDPKREKKYFDGHCVDDFWSSIKSEFVGWRSIAMRMYLDVVTNNKFGYWSEYIEPYSVEFDQCNSAHKADAKFSCCIDPVKALAVKKSVGSKVANRSVYKPNICRDIQLFIEQSWYKTFNIFHMLSTRTLEDMKVNPSAPVPNLAAGVKRNIETREAELLAGMGLGKILSKSSVQKIVTSQPSNGDSSTSKNATKEEVSSVKTTETSATDKKTSGDVQDKPPVPSTRPVPVVKKPVPVVKKPIPTESTCNVPNKSETIPLSNIGEKIVDVRSKIKYMCEKKTGETACKKVLHIKDIASAKEHNRKENGSCSGTCKQMGKCTHDQPNGHPCNCCYCTVFGHAPPTSTPVSRNYNETRERLRTILNKKKQSSKSNPTDKQPSNAETEVQENKKNIRTQQQSVNNAPNQDKPKEKQTVTKPPDSVNTKSAEPKVHTSGDVSKSKPKSAQQNDDAVKPNKTKESAQVQVDSRPVDAIVREIDVKNKRVVTKKITSDDPKARNTGPKMVQVPVLKLTPINPGLKAVSSSNSSDAKVEKPESKKAQVTQGGSQRCHSCSRVESKGIQTDACVKPQATTGKKPAVPNSDAPTGKNVSKSASNQRPNVIPPSRDPKQAPASKAQAPAPKSQVPAPKPTANTPIASKDSSLCSSSVCPGCADDDDNFMPYDDIDSLIKFIEEPFQGADKEKKQAKKARQKIKKLELKLLKERDVLHENLISMAGETSRLHEEVVRLERGLSSACRRLPLVNKSRGASDTMSANLEDHERVMLLRQAAQEASARATKAVSLAEHAQSRLRHVESTLNLLSSSVSKACMRQQKLEDQLESDQAKSQSQTEQPAYMREYETNKAGQTMVTIKRVILPYSEEAGVTITPQGSNQLIYTSHDQAAMMDNANQEKNKPPKKQTPLSWEATIAQINSLAQSSKKKESKNVDAKKLNHKEPNEQNKNAPKTSKKSKENTQMNEKSIPVAAPVSTPPIVNNANASKKNKKAGAQVEAVKPVEEVPKVTKESKKSKKNDEANAPNVNNKSKEKVDTSGNADKKKDNMSANNKSTKKGKEESLVSNAQGNNSKSGSLKKTSSNSSCNNLEQSTKTTKNTNKNKEKGNARPIIGESIVESEKGNKSKKVKDNQNNQKNENVPKTKKSQPENASKGSVQQQNQKQTQQPKSNNNPNSQMNIVNSLSSSMDKIRLNDDTTIELASAAKRDQYSDGRDIYQTQGNKGAPISSSIVDQLKSGVQFADLRLPPGITLTRVDPAKQQHYAPKPNIPLMSASTPAAYRPTPPAPPPPAVIMVDTTKLHADRESKLQSGPQMDQKMGKSKKSKKKSKKGQSQALQNSSNHTDESTKMVTLRNPMFHPTLTPAAVPTLQSNGKRMGEMRMPEPIAMSPNASCQATITPTSNGMYTIRNPLMSIVHQQSMMGMNPLDNVAGNPLLLMANQHLITNVAEEHADKKSPAKDSVADLTNKISNINLENKGNLDSKKLNSVNAFKQETQATDRTGAVQPILTDYKPKPCPKPIGTPFSQSEKTENQSAGKVIDQEPISNTNDEHEHTTFYTPFGPANSDKSFGSMLFQPYVRTSQENENSWGTRQSENSCHSDNIKKSFYSDKCTVDPSMAPGQKLDMSCQSTSIPQNHSANDGVIPESPNPFMKARQQSSMYQYYPSFESTRETTNLPKYWNSTGYAPGQDFPNYYNSTPRTGVSSLYQPGSSSSSCIFSGSSSVYDSVSNSSSNSPADSANSNNTVNMHAYEGFMRPSEYPYNPHQHHNISKSGMYNNTLNLEQSELFGRVSTQNGSNEYSEANNAWNGCCPLFGNTYGAIGSENGDKNKAPSSSNKNHGAIGSQRLTNGLQADADYFTDSTSVFAPNQSITNLNDLDSSERDIESFKRFDFYFEPPKNKPKISLNVQDLALQRPTSTKLATTRENF